MHSISSNFIFIHVPKTGGNSIQQTLAPFSDDEIVCLAPHHDGIERFEVRSRNISIHKHSTLGEYHAQLPKDIFRNMFKFSVVRNPWERCVSHFHSPHRGPVTFDEVTFGNFIEDEVNPIQHYWHIGENELDPARNFNLIIRFESIESDFHTVRKRLGLSDAALPRRNASASLHYRNYYTRPEFIEIVAHRFRYEIDRFKYTF